MADETTKPLARTQLVTVHPRKAASTAVNTAKKPRNLG